MPKPESRTHYTADAELTLSLMTLRHTTLSERITAAAAAGFSGVGWRLEDFGLGQPGETDIVELLKTANMQARELEFMRNWVGRDDEAGYREQETRVFEIAGRLGAQWVNVGVFEPADPAIVATSLAKVCRRATPYNLTVQLEFMPYTPPVTSLRAAWEIVEATNEPNAGLLIDTWHWARAGETSKSLEGIPAARITGLQLCDVLPQPMPDLVVESRHHRRVPGAGVFDLPAFLAMMDTHGVAAPLAVEVMSDELDLLPPMEAARIVVSSTRAVLWP